MFQQKKIYQTLANRNFTAESLTHELDSLKHFKFDDVTYTGLNLNLDMLMTQNIRDNEFNLVETNDGLAKKTYAKWSEDLTKAITIYNQFAIATKAHFNYFLEESHKYQAETGHSNTSAEFKDYFEQGNSMYFHDVLHSVFNLSRRLDLSINDFQQALVADRLDPSDYPLPEKTVFER